MFDELQKASRADPTELACEVPDWARNASDGDEEGADDETERTWRCASAEQRGGLVKKWRKTPGETAEAYLIQVSLFKFMNTGKVYHLITLR